MPGKNFWFIIICLSIYLVFTQLAISGTTGKISGRVVEKRTGEPLLGTNIIVVNTTMGTASDLNGNFTILNVPPGEYSVKAMSIGYAPVTISNVRVLIDQTARIDFMLEVESISSEAVIVEAERKIVKQDVATSVTAVSEDEVSGLPLTSVNDVVTLQAGVEEGFVIRGGGADESLFQVDGITLRDPRTNQPITGIALSAVKEISIERGGFNAEYGQVRSGIVNVVTKEGGRSGYSGTITLKYSPPASKHFGISPYNPNSMWLRPYLDGDVCWEGTKNGDWDYYMQRQYPVFDGWNAVSKRLFSDDNPDNDLSPAAAQRLFMWQHRRPEIIDQPDYNVDAGFGGPVPFIGEKLGGLRFYTSYRKERSMLLIPLSRDDYIDNNWSFRLTSDISSSMKLMFSGNLGKNYNVARNEAGLNYNTQYIKTPAEIAEISSYPQPSRVTDSRIFCNSFYSTANVGYYSFSANLTHMLSSKVFYETSIEYLMREYHTGPIARRDTDLKYEIFPGYFTNESPFGFNPKADPGIDGMMTGAHTSTARDRSKVSSTTFKFDLSNQVNFNNLIKTGIELIYNNLDFDYGEVKEVFPEGNTYVKMSKYPIRGALYLQDKLEMNGFTANLGLRLDYNNANTEWITLGPFDKSFFSSNYDPTESYNSEKAKSLFSLSPRLGISHPITANSKLYFNYGHFKQSPSYEQMFRISRGASNEINDIGDPNLAMAKTVSYELGYDHSLFDTYLIQLAAFYHDISDQQDVANYISADGTINYFRVNNNSYEDIRGFELTLRKSAGRWWTAFANYTYQVNTLGHFGRSEIYEDPSEQRVFDKNTRNLYQERPIPQPYARVNLNLYTPFNFGPNVIGMYFLGNWKINVIADWRTGEWITWNPHADPAISQNVKAKDRYNIQLRLAKTFSFNKMNVTFFADVYNVLNTKRLSLASFYDVNDHLDYYNSLHLPKSNAYDNIVGDDRVGDYRKEGVRFQPIEQVGHISAVSEPNPDVIYYGNFNEDIDYYNYVDGAWSKVEDKRINKILEDKAYIDMPNQTSFNFLNPRDIFFGITVSFDLH